MRHQQATRHKNKSNVALSLTWLTVGCNETPTGHNTTVHKNKSNVALNVDTSWCYGETPTRHKGGQESEDLFSDILDVIVEILVI